MQPASPAARVEGAISAIYELLLLDESEWFCLNHGKEITKKWLTQKLLTFGIKPVKKSHANVFLLEDLQDAFDRYLPPLT